MPKFCQLIRGPSYKINLSNSGLDDRDIAAGTHLGSVDYLTVIISNFLIWYFLYLVSL